MKPQAGLGEKNDSAGESFQRWRAGREIAKLPRMLRQRQLRPQAWGRQERGRGLPEEAGSA